MNYNVITQLLENGISEEELLSSIVKTLPKLGKKAGKLFSGGWGINDVLNIFSKDKDVQKSVRKGLKPSTPREIAAMRLQNSYNNIPKNQEDQALEELQNFTKKAAPVALGLAAPYVARAAAPMAEAALQRALPNALKNFNGMGQLSPALSQTLSGQSQAPMPSSNIGISQQPPLSNTPLNGANAPQSSPNAPQSSPNIPQNAQTVQPEGISINAAEVLGKHNIKDKVDQIIKAGNGPAEVSAYFEKFNPKEKKIIEKETGQPFEKVVEEYAKTNNQNQKEEGKPQSTSLRKNENVLEEVTQPENINDAFRQVGKGITENLYKGLFESLQQGKDTFAGIKDPILKKAKEPFDKGLIKSPEDLRDFVTGKLKMPETSSESIVKGATVATPNGIGEVKSIKEKNALVEVDGKVTKVPIEELQPEPEEVRNSVFDFDPSKISEDLRSAPLNEVYLPYDRRHITVKYNAGLKPVRYIYWRKDDKPIATDYINKIVKGVQIPVSSGKSFWGAWNADTSDSRGAANYEELVSNAQEEGEPDNPEKDYWFIKEESIYTHPYQEEANEFLRSKEKEFNEKHRKRKKKAT